MSCYTELIALFRRLDVIVRLNRDRHLINHTVAAHSYHVTMMCYLVAKELNELGLTKIDLEQLMISSLVHDLGEAATGDIIFPTKKFDPKLKEDFKRLDSEMLKDEMPEDLPRYLKAELLRTDDVEECLEGALLKLCDMFELVFHIMEERRLGNTHLDKILRRGLDVCTTLMEDNKVLQESPMLRSWLETVTAELMYEQMKKFSGL